MQTFRNWIIKEQRKDIFGFEKPMSTSQLKSLENEDITPIQPISIELMMNELLRMNLHEQKPFSKFINQIQWGRYNGATQMIVSPLGSFKSIIRRLQTNLEGKQSWICKRILPYKDIMHANLKIDENLAHLLFEEIEKVAETQLESAIGNYINLEKLVTKLSQEVQKPKVLPELFIFMGTKEIKHNEHYITYFELIGQGIEAPGSNRVEMFAIEMCYNNKTGLIKSFGHDVQSKAKGHVWYPQPSEWEEYFSPAQPMHEITNAICAALSTY